jgi:hypothetical protein
MLNKMSAKDARDNFTDLLGAVYYGKQVVEIDKKGRTFAIVINPNEYAALKLAARSQYFQLVDKVQAANKNAHPDKVAKDIAETIKAVRKTKNAKTT